MSADSSMDHDMTFPNPVKRTDLPLKRRRWPRILLAGLVLLVLIIAFLPQILGTKVGRRILRSYLESKLEAEISIPAFHTRWGGPTNAGQFWIKLPDGRKIGFKAAESEIGLWSLLRGNYKLGNTTVDGMWVDYVIDYGDGSDTVSKLMGLPADAGPSPTGTALPKLSGKITFTNGVAVLSRGMIDAKTLANTSQAVGLVYVNGTAEITALDQPWRYSLTADVVRDPMAAVILPPRGTLKSSGSICLGENGKFMAAATSYNFTAEGRNMPAGALGPVLLAGWLPTDFEQMLGPALERCNFTATTHDGNLRLESIDVAGTLGSVRGGISLDFAVRPMVIGVGPEAGATTTPASAPTTAPASTLACGVSQSLCHKALVYLNPFALDAIADNGSITLRIDSLSMPVSQNWTHTSGKGCLQIRGARLNSPSVVSPATPRTLTTDLALLAGASDNCTTLNAAAIPFTIVDGQVRIEPCRVSIGSTELILSGTTTLGPAGQVQMTAAIVAAPKLFAAAPELADPGKPLKVNIVGPLDSPRLDFKNLTDTLPSELAGKVNAAIDRETTVLRDRELERILRQKNMGDLLDTPKPTTTRTAP